LTLQKSYSSPARGAYDRMASIYDDFNAGNNYEVWLGEVLLPELIDHGLMFGRALDIGCGTGRAFEPLLARGWEVFGVEPSAEMRRVARKKYPRCDGNRVHLAEWDARGLQVWTTEGFDLVLLLNDVVNYLTEDGDLERCFSGVKKNLAPGGLVCFDANTLALFEADWTAGGNGPMTERGWARSGLTTDAVSGGIFEAELGGNDLEAHVHRERHWTRDQVIDALEASGLCCLAVKGQREDGRRVILEEPADESAHCKTIYVAGHRE
jgi:SAM-dependent methyltransferase